MKIIIQVANSDQLPELVHMARTSFLQAYSSNNELENVHAYLEEAFTLEQLTKEMKGEGSTFFVAMENEKIIGYIKVNQTPSQTDIHDPESLEVSRLYVLQDYLGAGIGLMLVNKAIEFAKELQKKYVWLGVWEENARAIRFYQKHGFEKFGEHPFPFGNIIQRDWLMKKSIA